MKFCITHCHIIPELRIINMSNCLVVLNKLKLLDDKFKFLLTTNYYSSIEFSDKKLVRLLPLLLYFDTPEMKMICNKCKNLKAFKSRCHNYYCDNYMRNMLSIFGNEKAWQEFNIQSTWKPKMHYKKVPFSCYYGIIHNVRGTSLFKFLRYKINCISYWGNNKNLNITRIMMSKSRLIWNSDAFILHPEVRSRRKLSMLCNQQKNLKTFDSIISYLITLKDILSDDGQELLKDVTLFKNLV